MKYRAIAAGLAGMLIFTVLQASVWSATPAQPAKVMVINKDKPGYPVDLAKFAVPGKTTIFDFYSVYCDPCMRLSPKLEALAKSRADVFVRKIDINRKGMVGIDWQSPAAKEYKLYSIPHLRIVGPDGKVQAEGDAAYDLVAQWIGN